MALKWQTLISHDSFKPYCLQGLWEITVQPLVLYSSYFWMCQEAVSPATTWIMETTQKWASNWCEISFKLKMSNPTSLITHYFEIQWIWRRWWYGVPNITTLILIYWSSCFYVLVVKAQKDQQKCHHSCKDVFCAKTELLPSVHSKWPPSVLWNCFFWNNLGTQHSQPMCTRPDSGSTHIKVTWCEELCLPIAAGSFGLFLLPLLLRDPGIIDLAW